jgi:KaiC/GvpD/RAD55 family RecA-like ATPase
MSDETNDDGGKASVGVKQLDSLLYGGISKRGQVLIIGTPFTGKEVLTNRFLMEGLEKGETCIVILTDISPDEFLTELRQVGAELLEAKRDNLYLIDTYSESMGLPVGGRNVKSIPHVTDTAKIQEHVAAIQKNLKCRLVLRSLTTIVAYHVIERTFEFLQRLTGTNKRYGTPCMILLDTDCCDEVSIQTLSHVCDGTIAFKQDGDKTLLRITDLGDVRSREWIRYSYTRENLNITPHQKLGPHI